jgi:hypothetical protein
MPTFSLFFQYIDLGATRLFGQIKVVKENGNKIGANEKVAFCNMGK